MDKNKKGILIGVITAVVVFACACAFLGCSGGSLKDAKAALNKGEPEQAIEILKKVTEKNPKNAEAWLLLGDAYKTIETYGMPLGDKVNAVKSYWEGYKLGNDECRRRLAWETCPLVSVCMEGMNFEGGTAFTMKDVIEADNASKAVKVNLKSTEKERREAELWSRIVNSLEWTYFSGAYLNADQRLDCVWLDILTSGKLTDEDYLFMRYVPAMIIYWEGTEDFIGDFKSGYAKSGINFQYMFNEIGKRHYKEIDEIYQKALNKNNPVAIEIKAMIDYPLYGHWCLPTMEEDAERPNSPLTPAGEDFSFEEVAERRRALLEPIKNKLTNNGKLLLAEASQDPTSDETLNLIKESLKGPYALSTYPEWAFARLNIGGQFDVATFEQVKEALLEARYTKDGGQIKDIIAKAKIAPQLDYAYADYFMPRLQTPRSLKGSTYPWLMFMFNLNMTFDPNSDQFDTAVMIPIRYNSLKDKWEAVLGKNGVRWWEKGDVAWEWNYNGEYRSDRASIIALQVPYFREDLFFLKEELPEWAIEILKPTPIQAEVKKYKVKKK